MASERGSVVSGQGGSGGDISARSRLPPLRRSLREMHSAISGTFARNLQQQQERWRVIIRNSSASIDIDNRVRVLRSRDGKLEVWNEREQKVIKTSVRVGAWGILCGLAASLGGPFGVVFPLEWAFVGVALTGGGIAATIAAGLVLRRVWRGPLRHLTVAGLAGVPFGISAAMIGAGWLSRDMAVHAAIIGPALPTFIVSGLALSALLGSGIIRHLWRSLRKPGVIESESGDV